MFRGRIFLGCLFYSLWVVFVTRYEQNEKGGASSFIQCRIRFTEGWQRLWGNTHFLWFSCLPVVLPDPSLTLWLSGLYCSLRGV